jgi:hypothetical protein
MSAFHLFATGRVRIMKRFLFLALALVSWLANSSMATAGILLIGDTTTLTTPASYAGPILATTSVTAYSFTGTSGGLNTGTYQELVVADTLNPYGAGKLSFIFQVHVITGDISQLSNSGYTNTILTDVAQGFGVSPLDPTGIHLAESADRTASAVDFNFPTNNIIPGGTDSTSLALIIRTDTTLFTASSFSVALAGSGTDQVAGFSPMATPEPASILLACLGAGGMLAYRWKRRPVRA